MRVMRSTKTLVALLVLGYAGAAFAGAASTDKKAGQGKELWETHCTLCHGPTGSPGPDAKKLGVADLSLAKWQASRTDEQIRKIIEEGKPDTLMQSWKDDLSEDEISALVSYVRTLGKAGKKK
jgi:cytochrome c oxidase cbb3-type subunit 2